MGSSGSEARSLRAPTARLMVAQGGALGSAPWIGEGLKARLNCQSGIDVGRAFTPSIRGRPPRAPRGSALGYHGARRWRSGHRSIRRLLAIGWWPLASGTWRLLRQPLLQEHQRRRAHGPRLQVADVLADELPALGDARR